MPTLIDFLTHGVHKFTASHPLYRSLIEHPPDGYKIVESDKDEGEYPCWVPTCPTYKGPRKQFVFIEDWHTLFDCGNGKSINFDIDGEEVQKKREWLSQPSVLGIITHMRATVQDCNRIFKMPEKVFYVPIGMPLYQYNRQPSSQTRFLWTSSHGGNEQESCWKLRGGAECLEAFRRLLEGGENADLTIVGAPAKYVAHPGIKFIHGFQSEEGMHELYSSHDVMVIPGVRVHSITVARALRYGMPVICSDGWGYDEFVESWVNGIICRGQYGVTWKHDEVFREDYSALPAIFNEKLADGVFNAMKYLTDPATLRKMSLSASYSAYRMFDINKRNNILKGILDEKLNA